LWCPGNIATNGFLQDKIEKKKLALGKGRGSSGDKKWFQQDESELLYKTGGT